MVAFSAFVLCASLGAAPQVELLEFYTDRCPHCKAMEPTISRLRAEGVSIRKLNADQETQKSETLQIKAVPTLLLFVDGQEVDRWEGVASYERLKQWMGRHATDHPEPSSVRMPTQVRQTASTRDARTSVPAGKPAAFPSGSRDPLPRPRGVANSAPLSQEELAPAIARALAATVRLKIDDPTGTSKGSGTIIDQRGDDALILTCGHIFRDSNGKGAITVDLFLPNGDSRQVPGRLLDFDLSRDLALVTIRAESELAVARVARPKERFTAGDAVYSVGCDRGDVPRVFASEITAIGQYYGPPNITARGEPAIGRSGGGLFNEDGVLIGVCNFASPSDRTGIYAAIESVHGQLARAQLHSLFEEPAPQQVAEETSERKAAVAGSDPSTGERPTTSRAAQEAVASRTRAANPVASQDPAEVAAIVAGQSPEGDDEVEAIVVLPAQKNGRTRAEVLHIRRLDPSTLDRLRSQSGSR